MKKLTLLLVSLSLFVTVVSCKGNVESKVKDESHNSITEQEAIIKTEKETEQEVVTEPINTISVGQTIANENMEITINKVEFSYDVLPDDTSGVYSHYAAQPGNVYIHIDADVKNLQKQNLRCDKITTVIADYNGGYEYKSQTIPEDSNLGFTYANITSIKPLETLGVRFLIECPQEVETSTNPVYLKFNLDGTTYIYNIR